MVLTIYDAVNGSNVAAKVLEGWCWVLTLRVPAVVRYYGQNTRQSSVHCSLCVSYRIWHEHTVSERIYKDPSHIGLFHS